jgi:hypothetical protein
MTADITTDTTFASALRHSTMLVSLSTSTWGIHRTQRGLSDIISAETNGESRAFAVRKNLLAGADKLQRELVATIAAFRAFVYRKTLPFGASGSMVERGPRIVANADFQSIHAELGLTNGKLSALLDEFETVYDDAIDTARANLGTAFDADDYPPFADVRDSFKVDVEFSPLPARGGFGGSLDQAIATSLDDEIEERQILKSRAAIADLRERTYEFIVRFRDRMTAATLYDPTTGERKPRITTSLFDAAKELAESITAFAPLAILDPSLRSIGAQLYFLATFNIDDLFDLPMDMVAAVDAIEDILGIEVEAVALASA